MLKFLIFFLICSLLKAEENSLTKPVKIVDGAPLTQSAPASYNSVDSSISSAIPPFPYVGPSSLFFLSQTCLPFSFERFEYTLCPFQNITQKRTIGNHLISLGSFFSWAKEEKKIEGSTTRNFYSVPHKTLDYFYIQKFTGGKSCGDDDNRIESTIEFVCEHETNKGLEVISLDDSFCRFNFKVGVNAPCSLFQNYDLME